MPKYMYSYDFPFGKLFDDEAPDGFVDTPIKLGINRLDTKAEIEKKCAEGRAPVKVKTDSKEAEIDVLKFEYEQKFGKKPHHKMNASGLRKALDS